MYQYLTLHYVPLEGPRVGHIFINMPSSVYTVLLSGLLRSILFIRTIVLLSVGTVRCSTVTS